MLIGAGDIADCGTLNDEATAAIIDGVPGTVFTVGDNAYPDGTAADLASCYTPSWGQGPILARTRPAAGNHDYHTPSASAYFSYSAPLRATRPRVTTATTSPPGTSSS